MQVLSCLLGLAAIVVAAPIEERSPPILAGPCGHQHRLMLNNAVTLPTISCPTTTTTTSTKEVLNPFHHPHTATITTTLTVRKAKKEKGRARPIIPDHHPILDHPRISVMSEDPFITSTSTIPLSQKKRRLAPRTPDPPASTVTVTVDPAAHSTYTYIYTPPNGTPVPATVVLETTTTSSTITEYAPPVTSTRTTTVPSPPPLAVPFPIYSPPGPPTTTRNPLPAPSPASPASPISINPLPTLEPPLTVITIARPPRVHPPPITPRALPLSYATPTATSAQWDNSLLDVIIMARGVTKVGGLEAPKATRYTDEIYTDGPWFYGTHWSHARDNTCIQGFKTTRAQDWSTVCIGT